MDLGRCRTCGRPVTAGEVAGLGILRPRPASAGGPVLEFECPGCKTILTLIPHGKGRYAFPGQPPPPPPTAADRAAPWQRERRRMNGAGRADPTDAPPSPPPPPRSPPRPPAPPPRPSAPPRPPPGASGEPLRDAPVCTVAEARQLLGVADDVDRAGVEAAYRERALTCHPDKVAHLDGDFVRLAEWKFRRLQSARDVLLFSMRDGARPGR